jgi:hypothetical protein
MSRTSAVGTSEQSHIALSLLHCAYVVVCECHISKYFAVCAVASNDVY